MEFLLIGLTFLIILLLIIWQPFFKQDKPVSINNANLRDETNVSLYHEHKNEIEKDYTEGGIDEENYQYLLAELDNTLLQDIDTENKPEAIATNTRKNHSVVWPIGLSIFIVVFTISLYDKQGSYKSITELTHDQQQTLPQEQLLIQRKKDAMKYIAKMQKHLESNPEDSKSWYNLGKNFVAAGNFNEAVTAFKQVSRIEGEHADLLGAIAQALYYKYEQQITEQVQEYIDRALMLDENDPSTNILLGMHNFTSEDYLKAISYWQRVINSNNQDVNIVALKEAVAEAKNRLNITPSNSKEQTKPGPQLKISVSLSDNIVKQLTQGEDRVVFVYAVPTNGQRMPLAAMKIKASDLPTIVVLNNSQAMDSESVLGSVEKVHVYAIVSKQGNVGIKPGDFKAEALNVNVNKKDVLNLVVGDLVD